MKAVAYLRVSRSDLNERNQLIAIEEYAASQNIDIAAVFTDDISGSVNPFERSGFQEMLRFIDENNIRMVVIYALDRLGRSFQEVQKTIWALEERGLIVISVRESWLQVLDPVVRNLILSVLAWAADFERRMISERTRRGLERARREGKKLGRPRKLDDRKIREIRRLREKGLSIRSLARIYNVSPRTIQRVLNYS